VVRVRVRGDSGGALPIAGYIVLAAQET